MRIPSPSSAVFDPADGGTCRDHCLGAPLLRSPRNLRELRPQCEVDLEVPDVHGTGAIPRKAHTRFPDPLKTAYALASAETRRRSARTFDNDVSPERLLPKVR